MSSTTPDFGACFSDEELHLLERAYDDACAALGFVFNSYDELDAKAIKDQLARYVIGVAAFGERNPHKLSSLALSRMPALEAKWQ